MVEDDLENDETCARCGRQLQVDDPRMGAWEEFVREDGTVAFLCPGCQTDVDTRAIVDDLAAHEEHDQELDDA